VNLKTPMLAVIGALQDQWGPLPEDVLAKRLAYAPRVERVTIEGSGHFLQMEQPKPVAEVILDFLEAA
jgi:pimeloyl-ACP methyl ester carboxylesterase